MSSGLPEPIRPGYECVGFTKRFWHVGAKRYIIAKPGQVFPIWRKVE